MHLRHSVTHDLNMKAGIAHRGEARGACFFGLALAFGRGATGLRHAAVVHRDLLPQNPQDFRFRVDAARLLGMQRGLRTKLRIVQHTEEFRGGAVLRSLRADGRSP